MQKFNNFARFANFANPEPLTLPVRAPEGDQLSVPGLGRQGQLVPALLGLAALADALLALGPRRGPREFALPIARSLVGH